MLYFHRLGRREHQSNYPYDRIKIKMDLYPRFFTRWTTLDIADISCPFVYNYKQNTMEFIKVCVWTRLKLYTNHTRTIPDKPCPKMVCCPDGGLVVVERHAMRDSRNAEFHLPDRHRAWTCFVIAAEPLAFDYAAVYVPQIRLLTIEAFPSASLLFKYKRLKSKYLQYTYFSKLIKQ